MSTFHCLSVDTINSGGARQIWSQTIPDGEKTNGVYHDGRNVWILNEVAAGPKYALNQYVIIDQALYLVKAFDLTSILDDLQIGGVTASFTELHCITGDGRMLYITYTYELAQLAPPSVSQQTRVTQVTPLSATAGKSWVLFNSLHPPQDCCYDGKYFYFFTRLDTPTTYRFMVFDLLRDGVARDDRQIVAANANDIVWGFDYDGRHLKSFRTLRRAYENRDPDTGAALDTFASTNISLVSACFERSTPYLDFSDHKTNMFLVTE